MRIIVPLSLVLFAAACPGSTQRADTINPVAQATGLTVDVKPQGELGWLVAVRNETHDLVEVVWDDSTFVTTDGQSMGRLMRGTSGTTRRTGPHDAALSATYGGTAQAASPIPAGATMTEWVVPESYVGDEGTPPPGRVTIVFRAGTATESWSGDVVSPVPGAQAGDGWWCVNAGDSAAPSLCARGKDRCDRLAASERGQGFEVSACIGRDQAACMVAHGASGVPSATCFSSMDQCAAASRASKSSVPTTCALAN